MPAALFAGMWSCCVVIAQSLEYLQPQGKELIILSSFLFCFFSLTFSSCNIGVVYFLLFFFLHVLLSIYHVILLEHVCDMFLHVSNFAA